jgi:rRNA biogenesis protein RRP5
VSAVVPAKPHLSVSVPFCWDAHFQLPPTAAHDTDSDDSGFDCQEKTSKRKRHKNIDSKDDEKKLFEAEMRLLDSAHEPQTDDEFARLVLQSPNSSLCWLRYVAFKVSTTDFDGARDVFEKALHIIPASEEQECLNIWTAYLNFENMYGSQSRVDEILRQAQLKVDPVTIQLRICDIYAHSGKSDAAIQIYKSMLRRVKLRADANIWLGYSGLLFACNKLDEARKLYQQALRSLEPKLHVEMARKFAQLEFKYGSVERGKTLFENMITNYPRRTDIWSVYIDVCIKYGDTDQARSLFDRVTSLSLPAKRIKFLFDRYLNFEKTYGSEETVNAVKCKAMDYVQSKLD